MKFSSAIGGGLVQEPGQKLPRLCQEIIPNRYKLSELRRKNGRSARVKNARVFKFERNEYKRFRCTAQTRELQLHSQ